MKKIAIIGAGPYGLIALERLIRQAAVDEETTILLFDPLGPGGEVWRSEQSSQVIMNTVMQHVTVFAEDQGPNLAEWSRKYAKEYLTTIGVPSSSDLFAETNLGKNEYCQRRYYGIYQQWFYHELVKNLPTHITVSLIKEYVDDLTLENNQIILSADKTQVVTDLILATGHGGNFLSSTEEKNQKFANAHKLFYQGPINPADMPLEAIKKNEPVILRGLGLSFYDYIGLFVDKWGGTFSEVAGHLIYQKTGKENTLVVGSGRGLPYHTRPKNQKNAGEDAEPKILTKEFMETFSGTVEELIDFLKKEAELVYYQHQLVNNPVLEAFLRDYQSGDRQKVLTKYQIPVADRFDWKKLVDPAKDITPQDFPSFIKTYLAQDIAEAEQGNRNGAIAAALDTFKELQEPFNYMLDHEKFKPKEYFEDFFGNFNRNYSFLTIGAPVIRQKQLLALAEAGIIEFLAPNMKVEQKEEQFHAYSRQLAERQFSASYLIEARLPATSLKRTKNKLLIQMRKKGYLKSHGVFYDGKFHETGALQVKRETHQVIDKNGQVLPHIFCYGIPLEGLDWLNAASPRPKSHDRVFQLAEQIARNIFK